MLLCFQVFMWSQAKEGYFFIYKSFEKTTFYILKERQKYEFTEMLGEKPGA